MRPPAKTNGIVRQNGSSNGFSKPSLPVFENKWKIVRHIRSRDVSIIISETASGKTTEIPKLLYQTGFCGKHAQAGAICVMQPRRVAATSVARYVASQMKCELGNRVGYSVRFDDMSSEATKIKYLTDGMLLRETLDDADLLKYSVVILDEAHERTVNGDVVCSLLKGIQARRKKLNRPLKIVIMSATVNPEIYIKFFNLKADDAFFLPGRQFQVQVNYTAVVQDDYVHAALVTVIKLIRETDSGDILVFCTGQEEIESMVRNCNEAARVLGQNLKVLPLYAALPQHAQERVFVSLPVRKVIFATNIAETSITITGIRYVVDTCRMKCRHFNPSTGMELLRVEKISQAQAWQRSGRAGRVQEGECYRLITPKEFQSLRQFPIAEIRRSPLANVLMNVLACRIDIQTFSWLDPPSEESISQALETLRLLEATEKNSRGVIVLNQLGASMRRFPLEPVFSRCIFAAKSLSCVEPMLTIISVISADGSPLVTSGGSEQAQRSFVQHFGSNEGDLIMYLTLFTKYNQAKGSREWCNHNQINRKTMSNIVSIRDQLRGICGQLCIPLTKSTSENIRRALVAGLFRNVAYRVKTNHYKTLDSKVDVFIHPSSCLFRQNPDVVIFTEVVKTTKCYIRNVTPIDPDWYERYAPKDYTRKYPIPSSGGNV